MNDEGRSRFKEFAERVISSEDPEWIISSNVVCSEISLWFYEVSKKLLFVRRVSSAGLFGGFKRNYSSASRSPLQGLLADARQAGEAFYNVYKAFLNANEMGSAASLAVLHDTVRREWKVVDFYYRVFKGREKDADGRLILGSVLTALDTLRSSGDLLFSEMAEECLSVVLDVLIPDLVLWIREGWVREYLDAAPMINPATRALVGNSNGDLGSVFSAEEHTKILECGLKSVVLSKDLRSRTVLRRFEADLETKSVEEKKSLFLDYLNYADGRYTKAILRVFREAHKIGEYFDLLFNVVLLLEGGGDPKPSDKVASVVRKVLIKKTTRRQARGKIKRALAEAYPRCAGIIAGAINVEMKEDRVTRDVTNKRHFINKFKVRYRISEYDSLLRSVRIRMHSVHPYGMLVKEADLEMYNGIHSFLWKLSTCSRRVSECHTSFARVARRSRTGGRYSERTSFSFSASLLLTQLGSYVKSLVFVVFSRIRREYKEFENVIRGAESLDEISERHRCLVMSLEDTVGVLRDFKELSESLDFALNFVLYLETCLERWTSLGGDDPFWGAARRKIQEGHEYWRLELMEITDFVKYLRYKRDLEGRQGTNRDLSTLSMLLDINGYSKRKISEYVLRFL